MNKRLEFTELLKVNKHSDGAQGGVSLEVDFPELEVDLALKNVGIKHWDPGSHHLHSQHPLLVYINGFHRIWVIILNS